MFATLARMSKASRRPLSAKRANKDYYKGNRQAFLPGGHRTGAPGKHVIRGKAKYRLDDEKVRVFVAPPIEEINNTPLKPYVSLEARYDKQERKVFPKFDGTLGMTPQYYLKMARRHAAQNETATSSTPSIDSPPEGSKLKELEILPNGTEAESKVVTEKQEVVRT